MVSLIIFQTDSSGKVELKKLTDDTQRRNPIKYPLTSTFRTQFSKDTSVFVLPSHELRKLARTAGRSITPTGFAPTAKKDLLWPYPCGRPFFKTGWQFKTVNASTWAAAALQLRTLWASVKWDDMLAKIIGFDGKRTQETDLETITSEILDHRVVGRFMERIQYLRRKTVEPLDAPATKTVVRGKSVVLSVIIINLLYCTLLCGRGLSADGAHLCFTILTLALTLDLSFHVPSS